jgi:hypothetical protein
MKTLRGHKTLHFARQVTLSQRNVSALSRNMTMTRLAQLRVAPYFIRKMCPFSQCEDTSYREQTVSDWVACCRDTIRGTIGERFLVTADQVKLALHSVLTRTVLLTLVHLNADLWTITVIHQKFLVVCICGKTGTDLKTALPGVTLYTPPKVEDKHVSEWLLEYVHTQCTVPCLNDWSHNWITEKQQIPSPGGSLTKFVAFSVRLSTPPQTTKFSRTFNKFGCQHRGTRCRKWIWGGH